MLDTLKDFQVYSSIKTMNGQQKSLITVKEAAKIKGVSDKAIYDLIKRGRLNFEEVSGKKFIKREDVENYAEGKRGRPSKIIVQEIKSRLEMLLDKDRNPENHFSSFFSMFYNLRRVFRDYEGELDQPAQDVFNYFTNENFRKNKRKFRQKFLHYERKLQTTAFLNQQIIVERVYVNPNIQAFFQYVLFSPEIHTESFSIDMLFIKFMSEFHNDFSLIINELQKQFDSQKSQELRKDSPSTVKDSLIEKAEKSPLIKTVVKPTGRKKLYVDEKGKIRGSSKQTTIRAIEYFNEGMDGGERMRELLFPRLKKLQTKRQKMREVARALNYQFENNPKIFTRPFDITDFKASI
jgi:excisionase family DNA binding protein